MIDATEEGLRSEVVRAAAGRWADSLVDLSRKNGLLWRGKSSTDALDLTDADPEAVSQLLGGQKISLRALYPDPAAYKTASPRLQSVRRKITNFSEEQGIEVGHVACGLLGMKAGKASGTVPIPPIRAPLLLQPVVVHGRRSGRGDLALELHSVAQLNPVLIYALDKLRGFRVDDDLAGLIREELEAIDDLRAKAKNVYQLITVALQRYDNASEFDEQIIVGIFSFEKMAMVEDLRKSAKLLAAHDIIAALAGHKPTIEALMADRSSELPPDRIRPEEELIVLDADSSQHKAISAALSGRHLLIEGPPGTGKSQTIANIVVSLAAAGKKVLFVAEKRAAITAVTDRLDEVGLARLIFDLHDAGASRRTVLRKITDDLEVQGQEVEKNVDDLHRELMRRRSILASQTDALHDVQEPWRISFYQAMCHLQGLTQRHIIDLRIPVAAFAGLDAETFGEAMANLKDLVDKGGLSIRRGRSSWSRATVRDTAEVARILSDLDELTASTFDETFKRLGEVAHATGLRCPDRLDEWGTLLKLVSDVEGSIRKFGDNVFTTDLQDLVVATGDSYFRARSPKKIGFCQRRRLVRKAWMMCTEGADDARALHSGLAAVLDQQARWSQLSRSGGPPTIVAGSAEAVEQYKRLWDQISSVAASAQMEGWGAWSPGVLQKALGRLAAEREVLYLLPEINRLIDWFTAKGLGKLLDDLVACEPSAAEAAAALQRAWLFSVLDVLQTRLPALGGFVGRQHSRIVEEFKQLDTDHLRANATRVRHAAAERLQAAREQNRIQTWKIDRQAQRRVGHAPLRGLLLEAPDVLLALYPCWAMSPLVVSRMLPPECIFDVVVFDEASQVEPHTAIPSIMRGRQIIIAGDEKQLPPTTFFDRALSDDDPDPGGDARAGNDLGVYESILDHFKCVIPQWSRKPLTWHYRSRDERLVAFANKEIYGGKLITFPGVGAEPPIDLQVVEGRAVPGQEGSAPEEVERVVQLVLGHAERRPGETLGVITLGLPHADRIRMALSVALQENPELAAFFSNDRELRKRFFVKNLEQVQGDERDAIILSLGHTKNAAGKLTMNFGPLTNEGGERRLNVAVTRARVRMTVVSSFTHHDMTPAVEKTKHRGPELLRRFLEFAANRGVGDLPGRPLGVEMNAFEKNVYEALSGVGIPTFPQWGVGEYRIDFALAHPESPGRMVLAVETDGLQYHSTASARERDRLRQEQLERLGWRFCRVWSIDWYRDPRGETARIVEEWRRACSKVDLPAAASAH
ncbi:AAA domain-containing protein [Frankia sp. AgPm24]|uniref:AAA domain-containing protein n=1 Tax=Frankia sp. AgPm24 TaxID=631128 RepID=UPI00200CD140|nr:AAA domain-containing protein [Frankia sp. AgPm24]MCK9922563.1 AAA domain-containing protein [Frankia sp. AgPm24]